MSRVDGLQKKYPKEVLEKMRSKFGGLVSLATVVGVLLSASCSASSSPETSRTSTTETKPYGSLAIINSMGSGGIALDPQDGGVSTYHMTVGAFLDTLLRLTPDGEPAPGLAERWEISADGLTHTFYIRKGVKFHDGSDLTGQDVKFSIERALAPAALYQDAGVWRAALASVELKDDYTVALHMKQPQFELLKDVALGGGPAAVVPKKYIEEKGVEAWRKTWVGSGPWKVVSYKPMISMELEANEDYWDKTRIPKFKNVNAISVGDEQSKVSMLKTGELDMADVSIDSVPSLKAAGLRILTHDVGMSYGIPIFYDMDHPKDYAFGDVRVRKALSLAINRQEMSDKLVAGYGEPAAVWYVRKGAYFYDNNVLKPDSFDPEGAKKLLAEAGYPNGFNTRINTSAGAGGMNVLMPQAIGGYWGKIGVKAEIIPRDNVTRLHMPKQLPEVWNSVMVYGGSGAFQFERMVTMYSFSKGSFKNTNNPRLDELIDKVPMTRDPAEKKKLALEAAVLAKNEYSIIATIYVPYLYAVDSKVGDITLIPGVDGLGIYYDTITHAK